MNIIIQGKKDQRTPDAFIEKKVATLSRYCASVKDMVVEVAHDHHHKKGNVARVELTAHVICHGNLPLRAEKIASDIREALDGAVETMKHLLVAHKDKECRVDRAAVRRASGKE
ncbi:HPF/RaiA family ribosome-associated protein [Candidatus Uhrbacteria bacterium]|nr:HPF/RaiA family ribosome-associated protein [Candidatus Uhrbacteria bacterium]